MRVWEGRQEGNWNLNAVTAKGGLFCFEEGNKGNITDKSWHVSLQLDQRVVFVVEFYETAKNDVGLFVDRLKETHGERLKSFVAAREAVSSEFANLAEALKENGVWGGFTHMLGALGEYLGAATAALQTTAQNGELKLLCDKVTIFPKGILCVCSFL